MTDEDLAAIRARCEAATAGPWTAELREWSPQCIVPPKQGWPVAHCHTLNHADASFIAAARADVPALLAEVERLRSLLEAQEMMLRISAKPEVRDLTPYYYD